jgi:NAD(P)-dependent dehydrogenase (short-subunit alcohol dehydrogenase family)
MVTEVGKAKININAVMPGIIPTPLTLGAFKNMPAGDKMLKALEMSNPRGLNSPENVAALVLFILSKEADRLTGQVISMN